MGWCYLRAPFLQHDLGRVRARLGSDEFLEVTDCIVRAAFYSDLKPILVVARCEKRVWHDVPLRPKRSLAITWHINNVQPVRDQTQEESCGTDFNQRHGRDEIERVKG